MASLTTMFTNFLRWMGGGSQQRNTGQQTGDASTSAGGLAPVAADTALQLSTVFACVRLISESVASLPLKFYKVMRDGSLVQDTDNTLWRLLTNRPNRYQTAYEFWEVVTSQLVMHGNVYILIGRGSGNDIVSLLPLMSEQVTVEILKDGSVVYTYTDTSGVKVFAEASVWHIKLMGNGVIGISPLGHAWTSLGIAIASEKRVANMAARGFKPAGVLMIDKLLKQEQRDQIRAQFADLTTGDGDPLKVLEAGMTYQQVSISPKDAQLLESRQFNVTDLCRWFGVPPVLVGQTQSTTTLGAGIYEIVQGFYKFTLRPYLERYESSIRTRLLEPTQRIDLEVAFDFDALLRGDDEKVTNVLTKGVQGGIRTPNEGRRKLRLPPMPGGDRLYMQSQMAPIEQLPLNSGGGGAAPSGEKNADDKEQIV